MNIPIRPPLRLPPHDDQRAAADHLRESSASFDTHLAATLARSEVNRVVSDFAASQRQVG